MQDMGAAGITCSTSEMSAKGKHGMIIHLDKVPMRQKNMQPFEILLSESQERMLIVVHKGREEEVFKVFEKWDLNCVQIGEVIEGDILKYYMHGELVAEVPADSLVLGGGAPVYDREYKEPAYYKQTKQFNIDTIQQPKDYKEVAEFLLGKHSIASKKWIIEQYDTMVGTKNQATNVPAAAGVVNLKGTDKALAMSVDCNSRYVFADPETGCAIAVAESARNIVCSGGVPCAVTNCLNFGNPYNPEVYWQFVGAINGMRKACEKFETPVTGGNVSFYNQASMGGVVEPVYPTPTIGMLGVLPDKKFLTGIGFKKPGHHIYMIGQSHNDINCSEYLYSYHKVKLSPAPVFNLDEEHKVQQLVTELIQSGVVESCNDVSDGGLFVTLFESGHVNKLGFEISCDDSIRKDAFLFGESQSRVVISLDSEQEELFVEIMTKSDVDFTYLGEVTEKDVIVDGESFGNIQHLGNIYESVIPKMMGE